MELRQLEYLAAVSRCGSFTRAAAELHVSQPAVSAQIRRLERELGTALFDRTTRRVVPTHAGELLLARAHIVLDTVEQARAELGALAEVLRGPLRVAATAVLGPIDLADLLASFHRRYPELAVAVRTGLVAPLLADLRAGEVDVVLGPIHDDLDARFVARRLARERLVLVTAAGRSSQQPLRLAALRDEPFVCLPVGSGLHDILSRAAADAGFTPRVQFEAPDPVGVRALVAAGLGVALLAESAATGDGPPVDVHRLTNAPKHPPIGLIQLRDRPVTPAVRAWTRHVTEGRTVTRATRRGTG